MDDGIQTREIQKQINEHSIKINGLQSLAENIDKNLKNILLEFKEFRVEMREAYASKESVENLKQVVGLEVGELTKAVNFGRSILQLVVGAVVLAVVGLVLIQQ